MGRVPIGTLQIKNVTERHVTPVKLTGSRDLAILEKLIKLIMKIAKLTDIPADFAILMPKCTELSHEKNKLFL